MTDTKKESAFLKILISFTLLWVAHCIGDYAIQSEFLALNKGKFFFLCFVHSTLWTGCIMAMLYLLAKCNLIWPNSPRLPYCLKQTFLVFLFLVITHFAMDSFKATGQLNVLFNKAQIDLDFLMREALWIDQIFHFITLIIVYFWLGLSCIKTKKS